MNKARKILMLALVALPVLASAQTMHGRIEQRDANQDARIEQGVGSGALTSVEAAKLERNRQNIERLEAKARADGKLTPRERARIQKSQNIQSRKIYRQKHDAQHAVDHEGTPREHRHFTRRP